MSQQMGVVGEVVATGLECVAGDVRRLFWKVFRRCVRKQTYEQQQQQQQQGQRQQQQTNQSTYEHLARASCLTGRFVKH